MEKQLYSECWYKDVCQLECECDSCIRFTEMSFLMDHSGLPKNKQKPIQLIPEDCDYRAFCDLKDIKDDIENFVINGNSLLICGSTGNGKTSWAIKILQKYFDSIWAGNGLRVRGVFVHVPTLLLQLKDFNNPLDIWYKSNLLNADLVVWDEIGGVGMSNYDYGQLLMYIDSRVLNGKSNIYTSNLCTDEELVKQLGERLASRINCSSKKVILRGKDRRHDSVTDSK